MDEKMKKENTNKKQTKKGVQKELFYYIVYEYNKEKNDIEYITSKKTLIDSINCINGLLLANGDTLNTIKDIQSIIKNRNISKYITLDINNIKVINKYIIFKQFINEKNNKKYILNELEKQTKNNDIIINKLYKKEVLKVKVKNNKVNDKTIIKKLDKKEAFKKYMEIKKKIENNILKQHENKQFLKGGAMYEI
jgi:hypothetical protein